MNKIAHIFVGPSGSGKTTYRNIFMKTNTGYVVISRDSLREALCPNHKSFLYNKDVKLLRNKVETTITAMSNDIIKHNDKIILDNTNTDRHFLADTVSFLSAHDFDIHITVFGNNMTFEELSGRVKQRDGDIDTNYIRKQLITEDLWKLIIGFKIPITIVVNN